MKFLNRLLYQVHRWVGLALSLFMFLWFSTGLVILYSPSITQNRTEQLAHAETLAPEIGWLSLGEAWERSAEQRKAVAGKPKSGNAEGAGAERESKPRREIDEAVGILDARLVRSAGEPLWLVEDSRGLRYALSALDGSLHETTVDQALKIADNWYRANKGGGFANARYLETVAHPITLRNQDALKPFHRIAVGDDGGELLISSRTGEVLHASNTISRACFRAGNWLHLFKPLESLGWGRIRHDAQLWLSLSATLATLTGLIIGWLRWRPGLRGKPTYSQGRTQPYREFWLKWHFWSGLLGGSIALFWALSGYLDTNPGKIFSQTNPNRQELAHYFGNELPQAMRQWQPVLPVELAAAVDGDDVVELNWKRLGNEAVMLANTRNGQRLPQMLEGARRRFEDASLLAAVERVASKKAISSLTVLNEYDSYYYLRHDQSPVEKPLPVLLVRVADNAGTRFYLDPQDGKLLAKLDRSARIFRWLYSGIHHWDFGWLYHRPIWDVWMLTWVSFGLVLGSSSLVVSWRLLKKSVAPKKREVSTPINQRYAPP